MLFNGRKLNRRDPATDTLFTVGQSGLKSGMGVFWYYLPYELFLKPFGWSHKATRIIPCRPGWKVERLCHVAFYNELKDGKFVRLIFMGRQLCVDTQATLREIGLTSEMALHFVLQNAKPIPEERQVLPRCLKG